MGNVKPYEILLKTVKIGEKTWLIACNLPNSLKFFTANVFYCMVAKRPAVIKQHAVFATIQP